MLLYLPALLALFLKAKIVKDNRCPNTACQDMYVWNTLPMFCRQININNTLLS